MLSCFTAEKSGMLIHLVTKKKFEEWLKNQSEIMKNWLASTNFQAEAGNLRVVPDEKGKAESVIYCVDDHNNFWSVGYLPLNLPEGNYQFDVSHADYAHYALAFGLGAYQFTRYKKPLRQPAQLFLPTEISKKINNMVEAIYFVRDCINTPTDDMGPTEFSLVAKNFAKELSLSFKEIVGEELLKQNYPSIYTVGRASDDAPRLLDLRWGKKEHPKVTLVGKGVCFDSGGLDLKPSPFMSLMKKDMAGGAHVLGLARMVVKASLPISLRVLIPVVENSVSGNAYRPGDIIKSRKGITIEIGNTDAEGRVILSDALAEAVSEKPDILIDMTTLTGAARVALGTDLPAVFSNDDQLVMDVIKIGEKNNDPIWRLPLVTAYRESINSQIADINNNAVDAYGGAITAALFLKEFVPDDVPWLHFDFMAWNLRTRPGRPQGGEAMALRTLFTYLEKRYGKK